MPAKAALTPEQAAWVGSHFTGNGYGQCDQYALGLASVFPSLVAVRGFYHCWVFGRRTHWWCVNEFGQIVDASAMQFPSRGAGRYEIVADADLAEKVPTGRCMDCGADVYRNATFCNAECEAATTAYLNGGN